MGTAAKLSFLCFVFYAFAAGVFFSLAFTPTFIPYVEFVALAPFFSLLFLPTSTRGLFPLGWIAGTVAFVPYFWWFFSVLPLDWAGIEPGGFITLTTAFTLLLAAGYFGLFFGIFLVLVRRYAMGHAALFCIAALLLWPLLEYVRTFLFSFHPYVLGSGSIVGDNAGFMLLSHAIVPYAPLRIFAQFFGHYGLSTIALLPNLALSLLVAHVLPRRLMPGYDKNMRASSLPVVLFLAIFFAAIAFVGTKLASHTREPSRLVRIAIVQTAFREPAARIGNAATEKLRQKEADVVRALMQEAFANNPDIVAVPEGTASIFDKSDFEAYPTIEAIKKKLGEAPYRVVIDTALPPRKWDRHKNYTTVVDNTQGVLGSYQKQFLMPWGEYIPWVSSFVARLRGFSWGDAIATLKPGKNPGIFATGFGTVGILTCSEVLSPRLVRKTAHYGADIIIFSSSDAVFHRSELLQRHILSMAMLHAAVTGVPVVYSGNEAHSFALDARGNILWKSGAFENAVKMVTVGIGTE